MSRAKSPLKRVLAPLVLMGGLALALHLHQSSGVEVTLNYDLLPLRDALGGQSPEVLQLQLHCQEQRASLYARLAPRPWQVQQTLTLPQGPCQIQGAVQAEGTRLPVQAQVELQRAGTYEVRLRASKP